MRPCFFTIFSAILAGLLLTLCLSTRQARATQVLSDSCAAFNARSYHSQGSFGRWLTTYLSEKYGDARAEAGFAWIAEHCLRTPEAKVGKVLTNYIETFHGGAPVLTQSKPAAAYTARQAKEPAWLPGLWSFLKFLVVFYCIQLFFLICTHQILLKPLCKLRR